MKGLKGSYTVEAALIMWVLIFSVWSVVMLAVCQYDKIVLESIAAKKSWELAWREEEELRREIWKTSEEKMFGARVLEIEISKGLLTTEVNCSAEFEMPIPGIWKLVSGKKQILFYAEICCGHPQAAEAVRILYAWKGRGEGQDDGPLQK